MDDAVLDFRLGIDRLNCRRKTGQIIRTGNENILDVPADVGLIFPQHLEVKFALAISRHRYLYIAQTGAQGFAAVPVPAVIRVLVLVVIPVVAQLIVQLGLQTVFHELRDSVLEQFLNVILLLFYTLLEVYTKFGMKSARSTVTTACSCVYPSLGPEPVILLARHNADLAHRIHTAACPIAKLGIIGVWFIACSTDSRRHAACDQRGCTQITPFFIKNTSCL